jgi:hypothetical protein
MIMQIGMIVPKHGVKINSLFSRQDNRCVSKI